MNSTLDDRYIDLEGRVQRREEAVLPFWFRVQGLYNLDQVIDYISSLQQQLVKLNHCPPRRDHNNREHE